MTILHLQIYLLIHKLCFRLFEAFNIAPALNNEIKIFEMKSIERVKREIKTLSNGIEEIPELE